MTTSFTVFFESGEKTFTDSADVVYDYTVRERGHLTVHEAVKFAGRSDKVVFKKARPIHEYPAGTWREVEINYGS